ncbi:MAG: hypothetical protein MHMPM18_000411 [Marteilia pararefringens]
MLSSSSSSSTSSNSLAKGRGVTKPSIFGDIATIVRKFSGKKAYERPLIDWRELNNRQHIMIDVFYWFRYGRSFRITAGSLIVAGAFLHYGYGYKSKDFKKLILRGE